MQKVKDGLVIAGLLAMVIYGAIYCVNAIQARNAYEEALLSVLRGGNIQSAPAQIEENNGDSKER